MTDEQGREQALAHALWERLSQRIGIDQAEDAGTATWRWSEPEWEEAAPGITYKILAKDEARDRVTMLVRLAPGIAYPPHTHAGVEELHLLEGELWIEDRKLIPGDYNRGKPGASDQRVWSETGCVCVLITSPRDVLR
ncbi:MAG: cupin domain-containing protein [Steroidobacteraceae bacterium]